MTHSLKINDVLFRKEKKWLYKVIEVKEMAVNLYVTKKNKKGIDCTNWYAVEKRFFEEFEKVDKDVVKFV